MQQSTTLCQKARGLAISAGGGALVWMIGMTHSFTLKRPFHKGKKP
jgi:hypothetical protein